MVGPIHLRRLAACPSSAHRSIDAAEDVRTNPPLLLLGVRTLSAVAPTVAEQCPLVYMAVAEVAIDPSPPS